MGCSLGNLTNNPLAVKIHLLFVSISYSVIRFKIPAKLVLDNRSRRRISTLAEIWFHFSLIRFANLKALSHTALWLNIC